MESFFVLFLTVYCAFDGRKMHHCSVKDMRSGKGIDVASSNKKRCSWWTHTVIYLLLSIWDYRALSNITLWRTLALRDIYENDSVYNTLHRLIQCWKPKSSFAFFQWPEWKILNFLDDRNGDPSFLPCPSPAHPCLFLAEPSRQQQQ